MRWATTVEQGNFFQALIQLAAANLKRFLGNEQAAQNSHVAGSHVFKICPQLYMGIDVIAFSEEYRDYFPTLSKSSPIKFTSALGDPSRR